MDDPTNIPNTRDDNDKNSKEGLSIEEFEKEAAQIRKELESDKELKKIDIKPIEEGNA